MSKPKCYCSICGDPAFGHGWCQRHYLRWRRHGDPLAITRAEPGSVTICTIDGCSDRVESRGWCQKHYARWRFNGDPMVVKFEIGGDEVSYAAVHYRVKALKGKATAYQCVDCGNPAHQWSYRHGSPSERTEIRERDGRAMPYSLDPDDYSPRCRACHIAYDRV